MWFETINSRDYLIVETVNILDLNFLYISFDSDFDIFEFPSHSFSCFLFILILLFASTYYLAVNANICSCSSKWWHQW